MAPKAAAKAKEAKVEPSTPKPKSKTEATAKPKKTPTSGRKPKITAPSRNYRTLAVEDGVNSVLAVRYEGSQQAAALSTGGHSITLRLDAPNTFTVVNSTVFTEGPYQGYEAIIIRPAKPFKFMELSAAIRNTVYRMYFAPKGLTEETTPIVLDAKRVVDKVPYSKSYAEGSKNRVGLLAVCKEVNAEASPILYNHPLRFESSPLLGEFLVEYSFTRPKIVNIEVKSYKKGSRMAFTLLAEAPDLRRLRIESGVPSDDDPRKAAKTFYLDAAQLLKAIGKQKQDKHAGVDLIEFAKGALITKVGDKARHYSDDMKEQFVETLKKLCKDTWTPTGWTCWCGNPRGGHICRQVMQERQNELLEREVYLQHAMLVQQS